MRGCTNQYFHINSWKEDSKMCQGLLGVSTENDHQTLLSPAAIQSVLASFGKLFWLSVQQLLQV